MQLRKKPRKPEIRPVKKSAETKSRMEYFEKTRKILERIPEFRKKKKPKWNKFSNFCTDIPRNDDDSLMKKKDQKSEISASCESNEKNYFECKYCSIKLVSSIFLKRHEHSHSLALSYDDNTLKTHCSNKSKEKCYTCYFCYKQYKSFVGFSLHTAKHVGFQKKYFCNHCAASFTRKDVCSKHIKNHSSRRMCCCQVCFKKFENDCELTIHEREHIAKKKYRCRYCGLKYRTKIICDRHELIHYGEQSHVCRICSKKEVSVIALMMHQKTHVKERIYQCHSCSMKFYSEIKFNIHRLAHMCEKKKIIKMKH